MNRLAPLQLIGPILSPAMVEATYAALSQHAAQLPADARAFWDLSYGPLARQRLNLFLPAAGRASTVLVFLHGGGFRGGDKGAEGALFFANVGAFAIENGWAGAAMTYRLVPEAAWPSGAEDVARAVEWLAAGAGGALDAPRIVLAGQSAGAIHIADYLAGRAGPVSPRVAGAVLMSGLYDFGHHEPLGFEAAYLGGNSAACSTIDALAASALPLLYTVSEYDPPAFQRQAARIVGATMARRGQWPRLQWLPGHNHVSPAIMLGAHGDIVGALVSEFVGHALAH